MNNSKESSKFDTEPVKGYQEVSRLFIMKSTGTIRRRIRLLLHFLAWVTLLGLPLYFIKRWHVDESFIWLYYIMIFINGIIFYSNYLLLIPKFFFGDRRYKYYISVTFLIVFFYFVSDISNKTVFRYFPDKNQNELALQSKDMPHRQGQPPDDGMKKPPFRQMHLFNYTFNSVFLVFFSLGLRILERQTLFEETKKELEKEKLNSELAFLKNQISPHFFFNTLNNIYSLIGINAEDSQNAVLKLSRMMRYLLYESETGHSPFSREIEFMNNYIDLMKLRLSERVALTVSFPDKPVEINIPPLLFIPFIENAFKHGISYREKSFIDISLLAGYDEISFNCKNRLFPVKEDKNNASSGIGLENVRKRLNLLFPAKHELVINDTENTFEVSLIIKLA